MNTQKNKKLALNLGIQTYQNLTNDDEVCIPSLSSILLAVPKKITNMMQKLNRFSYNISKSFSIILH